MKKSFKKCAVIRLLSYLLFAVVIAGGVVSIYKGDTLWLISFIAMFLAGAIALVAVTSEDDDLGDGDGSS